MRRIRFSGIVRLANGVQRELGGPVTTSRRDHLRSQVQRAVELVHGTLRQHGAHPRAIPGPTRRAYEFLRTLDFDQIETTTSEDATQRRDHVTLSGLTARVQQFADQLALSIHRAETPTASPHASICCTLARIAACNERAGLKPEHLTARSREHLAWLRLIADRENFLNYLEALRRAIPVFDSVAPVDRWPRPIAVHFRPTQSLFRVRVVQHKTRVLLPTPMITFDQAAFRELGGAMFHRRQVHRNATLHTMMLGEAYQELQAELEALSGMVEETRGMAHDLAESFERVNIAYFEGQMPRPRLTWNRAITAGKFGHYNYSCDTVMISRALDRPFVPIFVVDHVMHHELLHKKHGLRWHQGRGHAHTAEFRQEERQFAQYLEADRFLERLATR